MPLQTYIALKELSIADRCFNELEFLLARGDNSSSCENLMQFLRNNCNENFKESAILFGMLHQLAINEKYLMATCLMDEYSIELPFESDAFLSIKDKCLISKSPLATSFLTKITTLEERHILLLSYTQPIKSPTKIAL